MKQSKRKSQRQNYEKKIEENKVPQTQTTIKEQTLSTVEAATKNSINKKQNVNFKEWLTKINHLVLHKKRFWRYAATGTALLGSSFLLSKVFTPSNAALVDAVKSQPVELGAFTVIKPTVRYGFALDTFLVVEEKVKSNQTFESILTDHGIPYAVAVNLQKAAKEYYDFTKIQDGKPYLFLSKNLQEGADHFIFEPDSRRYIVFDFKGSPSVREVKREISVREVEASGTIKNSLWETMVQNGMSASLADMVEDALKYQIDLRSFQDGDQYKLIYEEEYVEGRAVGIKKLTGAYFKDVSQDKEIYAIYYANGKEKGWYSKDGLPMKAGFLKSPLKYSRITSYYSKNRLHPVLGYNRPHFGTDYAAPHGTPIMAVADGVVTEADFRGGNGRFVKIKHVKPYETQYLHMSGFGKGIKAGAHVTQGQVIGYVGSTGLATGPHVCFRFWKNGQQVNHLQEKLPTVSTFSNEDKNKFKALSQDLAQRFAQMAIMTPEQIAAQKQNRKTEKP